MTIYAHYGPRGGEAIAPEILLCLLFYGYATGTFSSRKIERATSMSRCLSTSLRVVLITIPFVV